MTTESEARAAHPDQIEARGILLEALPHGGYRAQLPNGHVCIARPALKAAVELAAGDSVLLSFHPADLSRARIVGK